jgi:hypothetical protein
MNRPFTSASLPTFILAALAWASVAATTSATSPVVSPVTAPSQGGGEAQSIELALDTPQTVDGMELLWTAVEDSRCPAGAACVWAGEVTVHLRVADGSDAKQFDLKLGPTDGDIADTDRHRLRLTKVTPYPRASGNVERAQRRATIAVTPR